MKLLSRLFLSMAVYFCLSGISQAVVILDFDSIPTGANLPSNPLVTADGTITASSTGGNLFIADGSSGGMTGDVLR